MEYDKNISLDLSNPMEKYKHRVTNNKDLVKKNPLYDLNIIPNHPSRTLFSGASGSGKTSLLMNLLVEKMFYHNYFDMIFIFSPSYHNDDLYRLFESFYEKKDEKKAKKIKTTYQIFHGIDEEVIQEVLDRQTAIITEKGIHKSPRVLFLFDDCIAEKNMKSRALLTLMTRSRHYNASVWITTQSLMKIDRSYRMQISNLFIFKPTPSEIEKIVDEFRNMHIHPDTLREYISTSTKKRAEFFHINKQAKNDEEWYRHGLQNVFICK